MSLVRGGSYAVVSSQLNLPLFITLHDFLEKNLEEKSLHIRRIFEEAARATTTFEAFDIPNPDKKFVSILSHAGKFSIVTNDTELLQILCNYKTMTFQEKNIYPLDDEVNCLEVSPETIFLYTTAQVTQTIPGLKSASEKTQWRTQKVLHTVDGMPEILLRGCIEGNPNGQIDLNYITTMSTFACDGNAIITQQLLNYGYQLRLNNENAILEFPVEEGRGALFSVDGVPFHAYNSYTRNDDICEFLGLFKKTNEFLWPIKIRNCAAYQNNLVDYKNLFAASYQSYTAFPTIAEWKNTGGMSSAITITLKNYIIASLNLQLANPSLRIKRSDDTIPSEAEIKKALNKIISFDFKNSSSAISTTLQDANFKRNGYI